MRLLGVADRLHDNRPTVVVVPTDLDDRPREDFNGSFGVCWRSFGRLARLVVRPRRRSRTAMLRREAARPTTPNRMKHQTAPPPVGSAPDAGRTRTHC